MKTPALDTIQETLKRILEKPELTDEDQQWLLRYFESADQAELKLLLQQHFDANLETGASIQPGISDRLLKGIHDKLVIEPVVKKKPVVRMLFVRVAAAAVIVALFLTSIYFLSKKDQPVNYATTNPPAPSVPQAAEVAPGTNGAMLTLSDGSTILLDSLNNGALKEEEGSKIVKNGNQVIYEHLKGEREVVYNMMSTPRGRQFSLVLADGTKVWLNAASSIRFPTAFTGNERKVEVTGELYFEVAKNPSKPFKVITNGTEIEVLGTHFNVDGYDDVIKTTLLEGSVKIKSGIVNRESAILKPGQQATLRVSNLTSHDSRLTIHDKINLEAIMAWKNGRFAFDNASLEAIMKQVSRWYDVDVVYQDKVPTRFFTADISRHINLSVFLKVLEESGVRFKIEGKKLLVQP